MRIWDLQSRIIECCNRNLKGTTRLENIYIQALKKLKSMEKDALIVNFCVDRKNYYPELLEVCGPYSIRSVFEQIEKPLPRLILEKYFMAADLDDLPTFGINYASHSKGDRAPKFSEEDMLRKIPKRVTENYLAFKNRRRYFSELCQYASEINSRWLEFEKFMNVQDLNLLDGTSSWNLYKYALTHRVRLPEFEKSFQTLAARSREDDRSIISSDIHYLICSYFSYCTLFRMRFLENNEIQKLNLGVRLDKDRQKYFQYGFPLVKV